MTVQKTVMIILERLQSVLQMESRIQSQSDRTQFNDLQSLLCATLQVRKAFIFYFTLCPSIVYIITRPFSP